jgi:hypothetical protein
MPRAGQAKPPVAPRLSDRIAIGVLAQTFPPELVDRVIAKTGRAEQRQRLLPARVVLYYTLAMCLFAQVGYEEVMRLLVEGLAWMRRWQGTWQVPDKSSIARARARLGPAPLRELFAEVARPLATPATKGAWYRSWRLLGLDGTTLDVADTPTNVAAFGRPGGAGATRAHSSDQAIDGLPTARGPTTLSDKVGRTAAVVLPVARRLDRRVDCPDQTWVRAGGGHVSSEPMPRQLSAASPGEPRVGRPAMASGQVRVSRGAAARLRRCSHQVGIRP